MSLVIRLCSLLLYAGIAGAPPGGVWFLSLTLSLPLTPSMQSPNKPSGKGHNSKGGPELTEELKAWGVENPTGTVSALQKRLDKLKRKQALREQILQAGLRDCGGSIQQMESRLARREAVIKRRKQHSSSSSSSTDSSSSSSDSSSSRDAKSASKATAACSEQVASAAAHVTSTTSSSKGAKSASEATAAGSEQVASAMDHVTSKPTMALRAFRSWLGDAGYVEFPASSCMDPVALPASSSTDPAPDTCMDPVALPASSSTDPAPDILGIVRHVRQCRLRCAPVATTSRRTRAEEKKELVQDLSAMLTEAEETKDDTVKAQLLQDINVLFAEIDSLENGDEKDVDDEDSSEQHDSDEDGDSSWQAGEEGEEEEEKEEDVIDLMGDWLDGGDDSEDDDSQA